MYLHISESFGTGVSRAVVQDALGLDDQVGVVGLVDEIHDLCDFLLLELESALSVVHLLGHALDLVLVVPSAEFVVFDLEGLVPEFELLDLAVESQLFVEELLVLGGDGLEVALAAAIFQVLQTIDLCALVHLAGNHVDEVEVECAVLDGDVLDGGLDPVGGVDLEVAQVYLDYPALLLHCPHDQVDLDGEGGVLGVDEELGGVGQCQFSVDQGLLLAVDELSLVFPDLDVQLHTFLDAQAHFVDSQ